MEKCNINRENLVIANEMNICKGLWTKVHNIITWKISNK